MQVVAEACGWPQAIEGIIVHRSNLAVLDPHMPGMGSANAIAAIRAKSPATRIIVLTAFDGDEDVYLALRAGAKGCLPKEAGREAGSECIYAVLEDETWIHPSAASQLADRLQAPYITFRESEVVRFVATGKSNKEIGAHLGVTEGTVKVHVNHLFIELGVNGRVAATLLALQCGIVHLPVRSAPAPNSSASRGKARTS